MSLQRSAGIVAVELGLFPDGTRSWVSPREGTETLNIPPHLQSRHNVSVIGRHRSWGPLTWIRVGRWLVSSLFSFLVSLLLGPETKQILDREGLHLAAHIMIDSCEYERDVGPRVQEEVLCLWGSPQVVN